MSLSNLKQPAKDWLADAVQNFQLQLEQGADPAVTIYCGACEIEIRLNRCPGVFERGSLHAGDIPGTDFDGEGGTSDV